jgi:membrane protein insertase Oxa1/YidC/SpoIIIJ
MTLPVVNACLFLTLIELGGESGELLNTAQHKMMRNVFRFMGVAMVPLMMNMPAGLFVYWLGNGSLSLAQIVALKNPNIKAALNIPMPPPPPPPVTEEEAAVTIDIDAVKTDKSPFIKLYEENMRLVEANRKLMEKAAKGGK